MPATSGPTSPTPLAVYDPETCSWRTSEDIFGEGSTLSSQTLPPWGTTRRGVLYAHPTPELPTPVSDSSSLLPTPTASDHGSNHRNPGYRPMLGQVVRAQLLPTPRASDGTNGGPNQRGSSGDKMLPSAVLLLPTPAAHDSGNTPEQHLRKKPGRSQVTSLQVIVDYGLLPTGGRIAPQSSGGSSSPVDPPPDPPARANE